VQLKTQTHENEKLSYEKCVELNINIEPLELAKMRVHYENKGCKFWDLFPHPLILLKCCS